MGPTRLTTSATTTRRGNPRSANAATRERSSSRLRRRPKEQRALHIVAEVIPRNPPEDANAWGRAHSCASGPSVVEEFHSLRRDRHLLAAHEYDPPKTQPTSLRRSRGATPPPNGSEARCQQSARLLRREWRPALPRNPSPRSPGADSRPAVVYPKVGCASIIAHNGERTRLLDRIAEPPGDNALCRTTAPCKPKTDSLQQRLGRAHRRTSDAHAKFDHAAHRSARYSTLALHSTSAAGEPCRMGVDGTVGEGATP